MPPPQTHTEMYTRAERGGREKETPQYREITVSLRERERERETETETETDRQRQTDRGRDIHKHTYTRAKQRSSIQNECLLFQRCASRQTAH